MNVVSSMLYFLGTKIQNLKSLSTLDMAEPSANKMSTVICKNVANGGGQPQVVTVDVPSDKNALLGVSQAQNGTGCEPMAIALPLSVEYGGTGRTTDDRADYVVEQGVDNDWYYRKWKSNKVECWLYKNKTTNNYTTVNNWYGRYDDFALPSFCKVASGDEDYVATASVRVGSGFSFVCGTSIVDSNSLLRVSHCANQSGSQLCRYKIYLLIDAKGEE